MNIYLCIFNTQMFGTNFIVEEDISCSFDF